MIIQGRKDAGLTTLCFFVDEQWNFCALCTNFCELYAPTGNTNADGFIALCPDGGMPLYPGAGTGQGVMVYGTLNFCVWVL